MKHLWLGLALTWALGAGCAAPAAIAPPWSEQAVREAWTVGTYAEWEDRLDYMGEVTQTVHCELAEVRPDGRLLFVNTVTDMHGKVLRKGILVEPGSWFLLDVHAKSGVLGNRITWPNWNAANTVVKQAAEEAADARWACTVLDAPRGSDNHGSVSRVAPTDFQVAYADDVPGLIVRADAVADDDYWRRRLVRFHRSTDGATTAEVEAYRQDLETMSAKAMATAKRNTRPAVKAKRAGAHNPTPGLALLPFGTAEIQAFWTAGRRWTYSLDRTFSGGSSRRVQGELRYEILAADSAGVRIRVVATDTNTGNTTRDETELWSWQTVYRFSTVGNPSGAHDPYEDGYCLKGVVAGQKTWQWLHANHPGVPKRISIWGRGYVDTITLEEAP